MISVIMSVYNAEKYLSESIESILQQTYRHFEFIIINDCSSDSSLEIINKYGLIDNRIVIINNSTNLGLTINLNKAINLAKYEFIARMDADDISLKDRFEKQIIFLENNPDIDVLGSFCKDIDEEGNIISDRTVPIANSEINKLIHIINPICHPTVVFRKNKLQELGFYNEEYKVVQDYDLWLRCAAKNIKMYNLPEFLLKYRVNDSYHSRKSWKYRMTDLKIRYYGYKNLHLPFYKRIYLIVPVILGILPSRLYKLLKERDFRKST
ncbi:glycosyltransferase [Maribacter forsetii]|uniref:glycosyltransferase n=1 Tax=Maribacter forsetii TaxID=444515 RepID=UPI0005635FD3|nr:glycosyltransferase [Maribacter forsetii]